MGTNWHGGSKWHRWDPHVHVPGTLQNDQFKNNWDGYLKAIELATPTISALGATDYCCLRGYKRLRAEKLKGRLPEVLLIFPNVEFRLSVQTEKRGAINVHLLVAPNDKDHVERIEAFLGMLSFAFDGNKYPCSETGLASLGRAFSRNPNLEEEAALSAGANQFKITDTELFELGDQNEWFKKNVLIAISGGADGIGGLKNTSFTAKRQELARRADLVFSSNPADRSFWAGHHDDFASLPYSPKPCLHGSDSHSIESVGNPDQERFCWIRSDVTFEGLRQTLVEPERRVHIGPMAPLGPSPSDTITRLTVQDAAWLGTSEIEFNRGLVTIIGMKGSGKTALADLLAAAAGSSEESPGPASFISKAESLLKGQTATLDWGDGIVSSVRFGDDWDRNGVKRVCYLSQQFVDQLCSPSGKAAGPLTAEIERVVFEAIPPEDRLEALSFDELRTSELRLPQLRQDEARLQVLAATATIADAVERRRKIAPLKKKLEEIDRQLRGARAELKKLSASGDQQRQTEFDKVSTEGRRLSGAIAEVRRKEKRLEELKAELASYAASMSAKHEHWKVVYSDILGESQWPSLRPSFATQPEVILDIRAKEFAAVRSALEQHGLPDPEGKPQRNLAKLKAEHYRLSELIGLDKKKAKARDDVNERIFNLEAEDKRVAVELEDAAKADSLIAAAQTQRLAAYEELFANIGAEVEVLERLYAPLRVALEADERLSRLSFHVQRSVNPRLWAERGEDFLDLRKSSLLQGRGALLEAAEAKLLPSWQTGSPEEVRAAMEQFCKLEGQDALPTLKSGHTMFEFAEWLFSTHHVHVEYAIRYGGVSLDRLSPGTRGIVLLTLYLGLDRWDTRPLIIDQPEENLDPQSIYDDLVVFFRSASERRQIIMVTHNANLVVNTDSDQVIVASSSRSSPEGLPTVTYASGPLEDPETRNAVCRILEGGEPAFTKRGQRYGLATTRKRDSLAVSKDPNPEPNGAV